MAQEEQSDSEVNDFNPSFPELQELYMEMRDEFLKLAKEVCFLRKENKFLVEKVSKASSSSLIR